KPKELNVNFDILQKLISLDKIKNFNGNGLFVEYKDNEAIVNKVENKKVIETYILQNAHQLYQSIDKLIEEYNQGFYYGLFENNIINNATHKNNFKSIELKEDKKLQIIECDEPYEKIEYINSIGMII
ncbi:MAG: pilus assembly protein PilM, partial [Romboutsia sp.]